MTSTSEQWLWRNLLKKYISMRFLWSKNVKTSAAKCDAAWEELTAMAKEITADADKDFVKKRINNYRTVCNRERAKVLAAKKAGKRYQPKVFYYDVLKVMYGDSDDDEEDTDSEMDVNENVSRNNSQRVSKSEEIKEELDCSSDEEAEFISPESLSKRMRQSPASILARRMAEHLEQMDADQALIAEKIISDICVYGRLKQLNMSASIVLK